METIKSMELDVRKVLSNGYVMAPLKILLILYAANISPKLPSFASEIFDNTIVKIILITLLAFISELDFQLALLGAIILVLGSNFLSGRKLLESYQQGPFYKDNTKYTTPLGTPAKVGTQVLIEGESDIYPGCTAIKIKDLLALFENDANKLQETVRYSFAELNNNLKGPKEELLTKMARVVGLPYNVELTDGNAPIIATLLMYHGYKVSESCQSPKN